MAGEQDTTATVLAALQHDHPLSEVQQLSESLRKTRRSKKAKSRFRTRFYSGHRKGKIKRTAGKVTIVYPKSLSSIVRSLISIPDRRTAAIVPGSSSLVASISFSSDSAALLKDLNDPNTVSYTHLTLPTNREV